VVGYPFALTATGRGRFQKGNQMKMQEIPFVLTGTRSLFIHADNVEAADMLEDARKAPGRKGKKGDDRDPVWSWKTYLYVHDGRIVFPSAALMAMLRKGGVDFPMAGKKTLKAETQASILFEEEYLDLRTHKGKRITAKQIDAITSEDFDDHKAAAEKLGFVLDVRRAKIRASKNVRVRPKFLPGWTIAAAAHVDVERISEKLFFEVLKYCGRYVGIGDWRPSAPMSPGPHGRFDVSKG
jgi:hypothetical protein